MTDRDLLLRHHADLKAMGRHGQTVCEPSVELIRLLVEHALGEVPEDSTEGART